MRTSSAWLECASAQRIKRKEKKEPNYGLVHTAHSTIAPKNDISIDLYLFHTSNQGVKRVQRTPDSRLQAPSNNPNRLTGFDNPNSTETTREQLSNGFGLSKPVNIRAPPAFLNQTLLRVSRTDGSRQCQC